MQRVFLRQRIVVIAARRMENLVIAETFRVAPSSVLNSVGDSGAEGSAGSLTVGARLGPCFPLATRQRPIVLEVGPLGDAAVRQGHVGRCLMHSGELSSVETRSCDDVVLLGLPATTFQS